jgi:hypothetical protein
MDRDEMSSLYRGPSIDAPYQVSVHLAEGFQRRRLKCEKFNGRQTTSDGKSSHCLWQGELQKKIDIKNESTEMKVLNDKKEEETFYTTTN